MWLYCSGSLIPNILAPDEAGEAAAEGTVAHELGEQWLKSGRRPVERIGEVVKIIEGTQIFEIEITHSMMDYVEQYVTWCWEQDGDHYVETKVYFSDLTPIPNQGGTADHCACLPGHLIITDLKFGKGEQVFALNNTQLRLYAYGFFVMYDWFYDFKKITIRIAQPRLDHFDVWEITREELLEFAAWVKIRAAAAWKPNAPRSPGPKQCLWCKVKGDCVARLLFEERMVDDAFDDLTAEITVEDMANLKKRLDDDLDTWELRRPPVATLSVEQKVKLLAYRKMSERWWDQLYDDLLAMLVRGEKVPGMKLVEGRSNRKYTSDEKAIEHLRSLGLSDSDITRTEVRSFTDVEEALRKAGYRRADLPDLLKSITTKPPGKATMVEAGDPRPAISDRDEGVFDDLSDL